MVAESLRLSAIRAQLAENARRWGLENAQIHVAAAPYGGVRIRVVDDALDGLSDSLRRDRLLSGIADEVEDAQLLTSTEEEWYGVAFLETSGPLPTWTEALELPRSSGPLLFVSDLDDDLRRPAVVTFYSLRGGVGRTTALVAAAHQLAARGRRVLCIDMDFEAPGLPYLFGLSEPTLEHGALPLLLALEAAEKVDVRDHVQRVNEATELYCMPAGRLCVDYARRLRLVDPEIWYREAGNPLHQLLDLAAESSLAPDLILLDSRTGIAPISAPLLFDVSDLAVVCFFPHPQAKRGTELLVQSLFSATTRRSDAMHVLSPEPRFLISPIPPGPSAADVRSRALSWIDAWLSGINGRRSAEVGQLQGDELTHMVAYSPERAFEDHVQVSSSMAETYGPVADWLEQLLPEISTPSAMPTASKTQILGELDFSTGTAEHHERFLEDFVKTRVSLQAMDQRYPLVIGRKGTGKTAVFRWLLERSPPGQEPVPVMCPNAFRDRVPWALGANGFANVDARLTAASSEWQKFWSCYTALAAYLALPEGGKVEPPGQLAMDVGPFRGAMSDRIDEFAVIDALSPAMAQPESALLATRWLRGIDRNIGAPRFLLFDGLDTGFGNDGESRQRRAGAVTGLFTFLTEVESLLKNMSFKVLLRFDIWQQLRFENKSHLFGRSVQLRWRDQAEYFKTALKQAVRSDSFVRLLRSVRIESDVDDWSNEDVFRAWNLLVGERMKGGKTTFTRNWVWNRLADGQGDHGPRALSQLFNASVDWEKREEVRSTYDRSIIRPRALVPSLESVSDGAVEALSEEFPELGPTIAALENVGRTPFDKAEIQGVDPRAVDQLDLALEVGLLAVHEGTHEDIRRFRVPDLYRHALRMTRRGQA